MVRGELRETGLKSPKTDSVYLPSTVGREARDCMSRQINRVELNHCTVPAHAGFLV